ncbi:GNAT family N-acetyltransferase [Legionella sp. CNM-4043-24]|uniref:GNAT family N-acetyltransferase n=1 Tax=Legionella sp. CNM-4043-24 TaxID=3421646 RepID=UPI00403B19CA
MGDQIVGFMEFESNGHIDCFYCHHQYQGKGVGKALMKYIKNIAEDNGISRVWAEVSITAKPFFEKQGFEVVKKQTVNLRGVELVNFVMECNSH